MKKNKASVRIPVEFHKMVKLEATKAGLTMTEYMRRISNNPELKEKWLRSKHDKKGFRFEI